MNQTKKRKPRGLLATKEGCKKLQDTRNQKGYTYEELAEKAGVNDEQVKRLSNPHWNRRVQRDAIEKIAKVLNLHPTDIVNANDWYWTSITGTEIIVGGRIWINADDISSLPLETIVNLLKTIPENISFRVDKVERGSIVLFFETSPEGFRQMQVMFRTGELTELLNIQILDLLLDYVIEPAINLHQWFQNEFAEAIQLGWLTIAEIFGITNTSPAFRSNAVKRSKQIQLGDRTLALILDLSTDDNQEISIYMGVYPLGEQTYLPENLHIIVFFEPGEPSPINVPSNSEGIIQELLLSPGEEFSIQLSLDDDTVTEYFTI